MTDHRRVEWTEAERAVRQDKLGIETHGEKLTQQEIEFCERLLSRYPATPPADVLEWIPRDQRNDAGLLILVYDFAWIIKDGLGYELKSLHTQRRGTLLKRTPADAKC